MNKFYYIVQEIGYEYNDECYTPFEDNSGKPTRVFIDKDSAEDWVNVLNAKQFSGMNLNEYGYSTTEVIRNVEKFTTAYNKLFDKNVSVEDVEDFEFKLPENLTVYQYNQLKPHLKISFFVVVKCEGEE